MSTKILSGGLFADMIRLGAKNLSEKKEIVNELNVFPVPDGDTGDNMSLTIASAAKSEFIDNPSSLSEIASHASKEMLLGARGNSGVILSRIFAGISQGFEKKVEVNLEEFIKSLDIGVKEAYASVANPVEGTILTVFRESVEYVQHIDTFDCFESFFETFTKVMRESIEKTPELLPSLKEAGVVDSGGVGLLYIFEGMEDAFSGKQIDLGFLQERKDENVELDVSLFDEDSELEFGYCTEFLLRLQNKKIKKDDFDLDEFKTYLDSIGNSVVCFQDDSIIKTHVHTKTPGKILNHAQKYGEFLKLKIENMSLQHNNAVIRNSFDNFKTGVKKKYGIVTVANGDGIISTFSDLGCDAVIPGGQSMNPSTKDFLDAFNKINSDTIFVFPNNKNIFLTAKQAKEESNKEIIIIETKSIGEGYASISMFDENIDDVDDLKRILDDAKSSVRTGLVSKTSRNAKIDGLKISEGDYIGFTDGKVLTTSKKRSSALIDLLPKLGVEQYDVCILFFGANVPENEANKIKFELEKKYARIEFYAIRGDQPVYDYILILE